MGQSKASKPAARRIGSWSWSIVTVQVFSVSRCHHWLWARRILSERRCRGSVYLCCCLRGRAGETSGNDFRHPKWHRYRLVELCILIWFAMLTLPALPLDDM